MKGHQKTWMETTKEYNELKCMKLKKKRSERKWNESQSSQPTPMHNPMHNQSQMKNPYIINWKSFPLHNQLKNFLSTFQLFVGGGY